VLIFAWFNANKYLQNNNMVNKMKKFLLTVLSFAILPMLFSCKAEDNDKIDDETNEFKMLAIVKNVSEYLEVEVIESDYAFGEYWVITPQETEFFDSNGNKISRSDLKAGDKIEISYSGQVMMSYPPKIVAHSVRLV